MQPPLSTDPSGTAAANLIDETMIEQLVRGFYARARADGVLGPIFAARIDDWEPHLQQIMAFWSGVMLKTGRYRGTPLPKHARLPVDASHFDVWLALFERTATELCPPAAAAAFIARARLIGQSLQYGVAMARGIALDRDGRLPPASGGKSG